MWFESLDQKQFMLYAQQSARLNTAYWLATLIVYNCWRLTLLFSPFR